MPLTLLQAARDAVQHETPVVIGLTLESLLPELPVGSRLVIINRHDLLGPDLPEPVEQTVLLEAGKVWAEEEPRFVGFIVPTLVRLYLEPVTSPRLLDRLLAGPLPCALITDLTSGLKTLVRDADVEGQFGLEPHELAAARTILAAGAPRALGSDLFVEVLR